MEQWEIDLRAKLQEELPDGAYYIGAGNMQLWTGKGGQIDFEVEMHRSLRDFKPAEPTQYIPVDNKYKHKYDKLTYEEFKKKIEDALYDIKPNIQ